MAFDPFNMASAQAGTGASAVSGTTSTFDPFSVGSNSGSTTTDKTVGEILGSSASQGAKNAAVNAAQGKGHQSWVGNVLHALDLPRSVAMGYGRQLEHVVTGNGWNMQQLNHDVFNHLSTQELLNNNGAHGWAARVLGFAGDVAADPLTYLTLGSGKAAELGARGVTDAIANAAAKGSKDLTAETFARVAQKGTSALQPNERLALAAQGYKPGGIALRVPLTRLAEHLGVGTEKSVPLLPHQFTDPLAAAGTGLWHALGSTRIGKAVSDRILGMPELNAAPVRQALKSGDAQGALAAYHTLKAQALLHSIPKGMIDTLGPNVMDALAPFKGVAPEHLDNLRNALEGDTGAAQALTDVGLSHQPVRDALSQIREAANLHGADVKNLGENYFPHVLSDEGRQALADAEGRLPGAHKVGAEQARQYRPGGELLGVPIQHGTVDELHQIAHSVLGEHAVDLFKTDPREAVVSYLHSMAHAAGQGAFARRLSESGVVAPFDAELAKNIPKLSGQALKASAMADNARQMLDQIDALRSSKGLQTDALASVKANLLAARQTAGAARVGALKDLSAHPDVGSLLRELSTRDAVHPELQRNAAFDQFLSDNPPPKAAAEAAPTAAVTEPKLPSDVVARGVQMASRLSKIDQRLGELKAAGVHPGTVGALTNKARSLNGEARDLAARARYVSQDSGASQLDAASQAALAEKAAEATRINDQLYEHGHLQDERKGIMAEAQKLKGQTEAGRALPKPPSATQQKWIAKNHEAVQAFDQADSALRDSATQSHDAVAQNEARIAEIHQQLADASGPVANRLQEEQQLLQRADQWSAEASRIEDGQGRLVANLSAQASKAEADLVRANKSLSSLELKGLVVRDGKVVRDASTMLKHGWTVLGGEAGSKLAGQQAPKWLKEALQTTRQVQTTSGLHSFLRYYDKYLSLWKAYELLSPGKAMRHQFGAIFNAHLGNVRLVSYKGWGDLMKTVKREGADALTPEDRAIYDGYTQLGVAHNSQYVEDDITAHENLGRSGELSANPLSPRFAPLVVNRNVQNRAQDFVRGSMFYDAVKRQGLSSEEAAQKVRTFLFDYHGLSPWERGVARRLIPFYTFSRKNFPLMMEQMALQPGKFDAYTHLKQNLEYGTKPPAIEPGYLKDIMAIQLPFSYDGNPDFVAPDLPFTRMGQTLGGDPRQIAAQLSPLFKDPIELWANKQMYSGLPFAKGYQPVDSSWQKIPFLMPALEKVGLVKRAGGPMTTSQGVGIAKGDPIMSPKVNYVLQQFLPTLGQMQRLAPSQPKYQQKAVSTWLTYLLGQNFQSDTPQVQQSELLARQSNVQAIKQALQSVGIIPKAVSQKTLQLP